MTKEKLIKKLKESNIDYKWIHCNNYNDLILYPDLYEISYFTLFRFYDNGKVELIAEDEVRNDYKYMNFEDFIQFVKNYN